MRTLHLFSLWLLGLAFVFVSSCTKKDDAATPTPAPVLSSVTSVTRDAQTITVGVATQGAWTLSLGYPGSQKDFATATSLTGTGNVTLSLAFTQNLIDTARQVVLTLRAASGAETQVAITQAAGPAKVAVAVTGLTDVGPEQQSLRLSITTAGYYTIALSYPDAQRGFVTVSDTFGTGDGMRTLFFGRNLADSARRVTVTVTTGPGGNSRATHTIRQGPGRPLYTLYSNIKLGFQGSTFPSYLSLQNGRTYTETEAFANGPLIDFTIARVTLGPDIYPVIIAYGYRNSPNFNLMETLPADAQICYYRSSPLSRGALATLSQADFDAIQASSQESQAAPLFTQDVWTFRSNSGKKGFIEIMNVNPGPGGDATFNFYVLN